MTNVERVVLAMFRGEPYDVAIDRVSWDVRASVDNLLRSRGYLRGRGLTKLGKDLGYSLAAIAAQRSEKPK